MPIFLFLLWPLRWQPLFSFWLAADEQALSTAPSTAVGVGELGESQEFVLRPRAGLWCPCRHPEEPLCQPLPGRQGRTGQLLVLTFASEAVGQQSCSFHTLCPELRKGGQNMAGFSEEAVFELALGERDLDLVLAPGLRFSSVHPKSCIKKPSRNSSYLAG